MKLCRNLYDRYCNSRPITWLANTEFFLMLEHSAKWVQALFSLEIIVFFGLVGGILGIGLNNLVTAGANVIEHYEMTQTPENAAVISSMDEPDVSYLNHEFDAIILYVGDTYDLNSYDSTYGYSVSSYDVGYVASDTFTAVNPGTACLTLYSEHSSEHIPIFILEPVDTYDGDIITNWTVSLSQETDFVPSSGKISKKTGTYEMNIVTTYEDDPFDGTTYLYEREAVLSYTYYGSDGTSLYFTHYREEVSLELPRIGDLDIAQVTPELPLCLHEMFKEDGYDIVTRPDNDYFSSDWGENTNAFFDADTKLIVMRRMYDNYIPYHELGHYVDWKLISIYGSKPSVTEDFQAIYDEESDSFNLQNASYARSAPGEYFAQSFAMYILRPEDLAATCPDTYSFIDQCMQEFQVLSKAA